MYNMYPHNVFLLAIYNGNHLYTVSGAHRYFQCEIPFPPSKCTPLSTVPALGNSLIVFINIYYCDWTKNDVYIRIIRIDNLLAGVFYERIEQINLFDWLRKYYILDDVLGIVIIV